MTSISRLRAGLLPVLLAVCPAGALAAPNTTTLWYDRPASKWVEALPIGNGRLGAMVFGDPLSERIQFNEDTLWSGGPYDPSNPKALVALPKVRELVFAGKFDEAWKLADREMISTPRGQMQYQAFGDLLLQFDHPKGFMRYKRTLDLAKALVTVTYQSEGVDYRREVFASHPDQLIVIRLSASKPGRISFAAGLTSPHPVKAEASGSALTIHGTSQTLTGIEGRVRFLGQATIETDGGTVEVRDGRVVVTGANAAIIKLAAATSYVNYRDVSGDPERLVRDCLAAAAGKPYDRMKADHQADFGRLFDRVTLELPQNPLLAAFPTDQRLKAFATTADAELVSLFFQFGRYLLISSSRPGDQPANLQGVWNESLRPPWSSKYTVNINAEMNYWVAEKLNLSECHLPLLKMVEELAEAGQRVAQVNYGARGWVTHHNTDGWRATGPIDGAHWGLWPTGGAWLATHLWDHFEYTGDLEFLRRAYPALKGSALFFVDTLVEHPQHKWMVTCPSLSPEMAHPNPGGEKERSICAGPTMDNQLLRDLFEACIEASKVLKTDAEFRETLVALRARLAPNQIGRGGYLQEWLDDWDLDTGKWKNHRHVSHLYGLFPSSQINREDTPELFRAAQRSLEMRGDEGTGWSLGWKINFWARLRDGDHAYKMIRDVFNFVEETGHAGPGGTYANLFGACPPFQIDSNFGAPSGICEMLLQSYRGRIILLPALPAVWPHGKVAGLRARGGFEVAVAWEKGRLQQVRITSLLGQPVELRYGDRSRKLTLAKGETVVLDPELD